MQASWMRGMSILLAAGACGCAATSSSRWDIPVVRTALPLAGPVFVMEPIVVGAASPGNVGRDLDAIRAGVADRILSVVRERFPQAELAAAGRVTGAPAAAEYRRATRDLAVTPEEIDAASQACQRGATHLIVPTITEWKEMRTDDPIGALILPHNRISVTLRLMRLAPPAIAGRVTFVNRARVTLNQRAIGLLDERFRRVVLLLASGRG